MAKPSAQQTYVFRASLLSSAGAVTPKSVVVLAGDGAPPSLTGGWAKVQNIDRARRLGFTMATGYDGFTMEVPLLFTSVVSSSVESDIETLIWMAGRGRSYGNAPYFAAEGDPPLVTVASYNAQGQETNLVPAAARGLAWLISGIAFDNTGALLDINGNRTKIAATVSLTQYVPTPGANYDTSSASSAVSKALANKKAFVTFVACSGCQTVAQITARCTGRTNTATYSAVMTLCRQMGTQVTSAYKVLSLGTKVYVPSYLTVVSD